MTYNIQPAIDAVPLGTSADVRAIPASTVSGTGQASQSDLFPAETSQPVASGGLPPSRLDFNALFKLLGASTYFLQHGGVFGYDATLNYDKGAFVSYDECLYTPTTVDAPRLRRMRMEIMTTSVLRLWT